jgi:serine/threonine protein phosphatase 1
MFGPADIRFAAISDAIHDQERFDCLWIRQPFLEHAAHFSHVIVHGDTVRDSRRPFVTTNRIALDTGAYATGHLTTLIIDPNARSLEFAWTRSQTEIDIEVGFVEPLWSDIPNLLIENFDIQRSSSSYC